MKVISARSVRLAAGIPAIALAAMSTTAVAVSPADPDADTVTALMMGGTGMPVLRMQWMESILADYIEPATGASYAPIGVDYPAGLPVDHTVRIGLTDLQAAMAQQQASDPGAPYLIEGYSLSALIAVELKRQLAAMVNAGQPAPEVTLALFGSGNRPSGGLFERLDGLYVPVLGVDANGAEPTDLGIPTIDFAAQYDGGADFPQYPINLLADLNAALGFIYVHGAYGDGAVAGLDDIGGTAAPLTGPFIDHYVEGSTATVLQQHGDTTFYLQPTAELPLLGPLRTLGVPESLLNIVQPALRVIVEAGYDRSVPLWQPTPAQLFPTLDPVTFTIEFAKAVVQGVNNAFGLIGAQLPGYAALDGLLTTAQTWSAEQIGAPWHDAVSALNDAVNPISVFLQLEGPIGHGVEEVLTATGIQQALNPILELIGTVGGWFTG